MTSPAFDATNPTITTTEVVNAFKASPARGFAFHSQRAVADVLTSGGTLAVGFAVGGLPGLLITGGALAVTQMFSNIGRNHDVRERPLIETTTHIERLGERTINKLGPKPAQRQIWSATEDELARYARGRLDSALLHRIAQSLPVKALYAYPRLAVAKVRDFMTTTGSYIYNGPAGVSFHEGVAARRLQRAGLITPNPRTQEHIRLARQWHEAKGKTLG